jgi:hypothetical protein
MFKNKKPTLYFENDCLIVLSKVTHVCFHGNVAKIYMHNSISYVQIEYKNIEEAKQMWMDLLA